MMPCERSLLLRVREIVLLVELKHNLFLKLLELSSIPLEIDLRYVLKRLQRSRDAVRLIVEGVGDL